LRTKVVFSCVQTRTCHTSRRPVHYLLHLSKLLDAGSAVCTTCVFPSKGDKQCPRLSPFVCRSGIRTRTMHSDSFTQTSTNYITRPCMHTQYIYVLYTLKCVSATRLGIHLLHSLFLSLLPLMRTDGGSEWVISRCLEVMDYATSLLPNHPAGLAI
jgi:hypothetical protein